MRLVKYFAIGALALSVWGCGPSGSRQEGGTVVGAVAGGIIGNQFGSGAGRALATVGGAVIGGIIGSEVGRSMDEADRQMAIEAEYAALEYEEERRWRNERNGHYGYIRPRKAYRYSGMRCREYEHTVYIRGRPETMVGKACKQPDGTWKSVG
jgi:surface antigen